MAPGSRRHPLQLDDVVIGLFELGLTESGRAQVGNNYTSTGFRPALVP